jgi:hypothetical protein
MAVALLLAIPSSLFAEPEDVTKLKNDWRAAVDRWAEEARKTQTFEQTAPPVGEFRPKYRGLAEKYAGKPEALGLLIWLADDGVAGPEDREGRQSAKWAIEQMTKDHAANPEIKGRLAPLQYLDETVGQEPLISLYDKIIETNPDREAKAAATLNLGILHQRDVREGSDDQPPRKAAQAMAMKSFRSLKTDYVDTKAAERVDGYIFQLENLQIGMRAPEIVGTDADGKEIRLSQFAGKVVMLDYWGFW